MHFYIQFESFKKFYMKVSYLIVDDADEEFEKLQDASVEDRRYSFLNIPPFDVKNKEDKTFNREDTMETVVSDIQLNIDNINSSSGDRRQSTENMI